MRSLKFSWDDRQKHRRGGRYNGWKRRAKWYDAGSENAAEAKDIKIEFQDEDGVITRWYKDDRAAAMKDYEEFKKGNLSVQALRLAGY